MYMDQAHLGNSDVWAEYSPSIKRRLEKVSPAPCLFQRSAVLRGSTNICRKYIFSSVDVVSDLGIPRENFYGAVGMSVGSILFHFCSILMSSRVNTWACIGKKGDLRATNEWHSTLLKNKAFYFRGVRKAHYPTPSKTQLLIRVLAWYRAGQMSLLWGLKPHSTSKALFLRYIDLIFFSS